MPLSTDMKRTRYTASSMHLIRTAEKLYGERGIFGVSLREIASVAGNGNIHAVKYYFGNRDGLVKEIFQSRMIEMEPMRENLLNDAISSGKSQDCLSLITALCLPMASMTDNDGIHTYASFHNQHRSTYFRKSDNHKSIRFIETSPVISEITEKLISCLDHLSPSMVRDRIGYCFMMFCDMLIQTDMKKREGEPICKSYAQDVLIMMDAALRAPRV